MRPRIDRNHPLYGLFANLVDQALVEETPRLASAPVHAYLSRLLADFAFTDNLFALKDERGRPIQSVLEMAAEGDVRTKADSFEREREVNKHIGDYILFWSGLNPDFLRRLKLDGGKDLVCDYTGQGKLSYYIVSTFDYPPHAQEAPTFRSLSEGFEGFAVVLARVGRDLPLRPAA